MAENEASSSLAKSSIVTLLKGFSAEEIKEFTKFVDSPFFNDRGNVTSMYKELKKYYPEFTGKDLSKEKLFKKLYPGIEYKDDVMRRLTSNLFKLAEEFISYKKFRGNGYNYQKNLLERYSEMNVDSLFQKQLKKVEEYLENQKTRGSVYYERKYYVMATKRSYTDKKAVTHAKTNLEGEIHSLWQYAVISLLALYWQAAYVEKIYSNPNKLKSLKHLLRIIDDTDFSRSETTEMFYLALKLYTNSRTDETFFRLKDLLKSNAGMIDDNEENHCLFVSLLEYCFDKKMIIDKDYTQYEFEIVKQMLETGLLTQSGSIHPEWFIYVVQRAVNIGEFSYAEKFIENYKNRITGEENFNVICHSYALLAMLRKDYSTALEYLAKTKYKNATQKLRINYMLACIYYEAGMLEQFIYLMDSFKHILKNEKTISGPLKKLYENFIKYAYALYRIRIKELKTPLHELKQQIAGSNTMGIKWLLGKLAELEKKDK